MQKQKVLGYIKLALIGSVALQTTSPSFADNPPHATVIRASQPVDQGKATTETQPGVEKKTEGSSKTDSEVKSEAPKVDPAAKPVEPAKITTSSPRFDISQGFSQIAEKAVPAVVNVSTTQVIERRGERGVPQFPPGSPFEEFFKEFFDQMERPRRVTSLGSGFIVKSDEGSAFVVTNYHVVADAKEISIFLHDNSELKATIHAVDDRTDIALLKVKTDALPSERRKLPTVEWGDSHKAKVGDWVVAIGNPFGLGSTVTCGIISNRARDIGMRGGNRSRVSEYVDDFMQHDASINMGNSGGPLFNLEGKVVGINTAIFSPSGGNVGIGFAIPSAVASDAVRQLIEFGRTKRGWLGVRIQMVTDDVAESLGLGKARGAIVGKVIPNGPASNAGVEPGDIILEFDGKEIGDKTRLSRVVGEAEVGKKAKLKLWRKGKEMTVDVTLGEFETSADSTPADTSKAEKGTQPSAGVEAIGIRVAEPSAELMQKYDLKEQKGVVVIDLSPDIAAATLLNKGDVILEVNQKEIKTPDDFSKYVNEAKKLGRKNILLLVSRHGEVSFVTVRLESDDEKDKKQEKSPNKK
jgi:serine protease Do